MTDKTCDMWQLLIIYDYLCKNMMRHKDEVRILELPPEPVARLKTKNGSFQILKKQGGN